MGVMFCRLLLLHGEGGESGIFWGDQEKNCAKDQILGDLTVLFIVQFLSDKNV